MNFIENIFVLFGFGMKVLNDLFGSALMITCVTVINITKFKFIFFQNQPFENFRNLSYRYLSSISQVNWAKFQISTDLCVCLCLRPSTRKASSVWVGIRGNRSTATMLLSSAKSLHLYFSLKHPAFLISRFIHFTHQKWKNPRLNQLYMRLISKHEAFSYHYQGSPSVRATS